jgi:hypothetical protein
MKAKGTPRTAPIAKMLRRLLPNQSVVASSKKKYAVPIVIRKTPQRAVILHKPSDRTDIGGFYNCGQIWADIKNGRDKAKQILSLLA